VTDFALQCFQNEYLPAGAAEVNAVVTVTASGAGDGSPVSAGSAPGVEVIAVDTSGSMSRGGKIYAARQACAAAVAALRDGVRFALVSGSHTAQVVYPGTGGLAVASDVTRAEATRAAGGLVPNGGTAIGAWLQKITDLVQWEAGIRHAILLTDGRDESEHGADLEAALARASGVFQCDCRGVGVDWEVAELRRVAVALLGSVDIVADAAKLSEDFTAMMSQAMGKAVADVALRLWAPKAAEVVFVKQVAPDLSDLTGRRSEVSASSGDYPTGAWGDESRDYHICVKVTPGNVGNEMLAGRVSLVVGGEVAGQALIKAIWTDDTELSTKINRTVAHYTGQAEMADAIAEGLEARKNGDVDTAKVKLGRAVQLAAASGNTETADLLARVVDVDDAATGKVRLKARVDEADEMTLDTRSTKTVRVGRS
jgi:hypothetical protein